MSFNPNHSKHAQEVLLSNKATKTNHPNVIFNGNKVQNSANQKHLGLILDEKLTFNDHITSKLTTVNKLTSTLRKLYHYRVSSNKRPWRLLNFENVRCGVALIRGRRLFQS